MTFEPDVPLTWGAQLAHAERVLIAAGTPAPRDEAFELLGFLLGAPAALLLAQPASPISRAEAETFGGWVSRRAAGEAIPHITGRLEFMGLELSVERDSPLPAPGARRLVELALEWTRRRPPGELLVAEIGAGCGAISLALASFEPRLTRVYAVEPSATALETAAENGARYLLNLMLIWLAGDGPASVPEPVDVLVCGQFEPSTVSATRLLEQAPAKLRQGGALLCGLAGGREVVAAEALTRAFPHASVWVDSLAGELPVAIAQLPDNR